MLINIITVLHVLVSLGLITTVLLQSGKSAGLGVIGGGAEALFGKRKGIDEVLGKVSTGLAGTFIVTAITLTLLGS
ncbi:MAG: preprotein translocase subunit SecG [Bacillota bacterium]